MHTFNLPTGLNRGIIGTHGNEPARGIIGTNGKEVATDPITTNGHFTDSFERIRPSARFGAKKSIGAATRSPGSNI